jgi:hypothetical protein
MLRKACINEKTIHLRRRATEILKRDLPLVVRMHPLVGCDIVRRSHLGHVHRRRIAAVSALAGLAEVGEPMSGAGQQLCRIRAGANPETKKDVVWFALNEDRPLFAFAGIWTEFKGDRGTKSKPVPALSPSMVF